MTNVGHNMQCAYISEVEETLTFKLLKILKSKDACETANRNKYKRYWAQWNSLLVRYNVLERHCRWTVLESPSSSSTEKGAGGIGMDPWKIFERTFGF
jgi:hypothetical protein